MEQLSNHEIKALGQALSYAVMYAKTEEETAEFAMLKVKVEGQIVRRNDKLSEAGKKEDVYATLYQKETDIALLKQELAEMEKNYEERILQLHLKQIEHLKELSKPQSEGKELSGLGVEITKEDMEKRKGIKITDVVWDGFLKHLNDKIT